MSLMDFEFEGPIVEWRGPPPYYFLRVPEEESADIKFAAKGIEYWGQVPVRVRINGTEFTTALFPKDGCYLIPLKVAARKSVGIDVEVDTVLAVALDVVRDRRSFRGQAPGSLASTAHPPAPVLPARNCPPSVWMRSRRPIRPRPVPTRRRVARRTWSFSTRTARLRPASSTLITIRTSAPGA